MEGETTTDGQNLPSAGDQHSSLKSFLVSKMKLQGDPSSPNGSTTGIPLPPIRPQQTVPTNQRVMLPSISQALDVSNRPGEASPQMSSSDVLMSSFNVLEDGDPVHSYQVQYQQGTPTEHQQGEYPSQPVAISSWSRGPPDHNSTAILRALREPPEGHSNEQLSWKTNQNVVTSSTGSQQWNSYNQSQDQDYQEYVNYTNNSTVQDLSTSTNRSRNQEKKFDERPLESQPSSLPDTTSEGTLTRTVKETFCIAHFSCSHCNEKFRVPEKLAEHVKKVHSGSIIYTCFTCGKKYYNSFDLREHVLSHANDPIKCSLCDLTLSSSKELRNHHKKCHPVFSLSCPLCDRSFSNTGARTKHLLAEHQDHNRLIVCDLCGEAFLDKASYDEHCKNHPRTTQTQSAIHYTEDAAQPAAVVIWKCDKCGTVCQSDKELVIHKETQHQEDYIKAPVSQSLQSTSLQKIPVKQSSVNSRYELLRLLLAKRMAASTKVTPSKSDVPSSNLEGLALKSDKYSLIANDSKVKQQSKMADLAQDLTSPNRGLDMLSAETMQHVADELSILEKSNSKKGLGDQIVTSQSLPLTADMMMDGESTIGIRLALKKNASQDMKFQEIHKQKTLVNMLQGTVASIIEKEVKCTKALNKIEYDIPSDLSLHNQSIGSYPTTSYGMTDQRSEHVYIKGNNKYLENNNVIYENRNLSGGQMDITGQGLGNVEPATSQANFPGLIDTNPLPQTSVQSNANNMLSDDAINKYTKATSPWDDHIAPLLKLFQNVNTPGMGNVSQESQFVKQKADDQNLSYLLQKDGILDLSGSSSNSASGNTQNALQNVNTNLQTSHLSKSGEIAQSYDVTPGTSSASSGIIHQTVNAPASNNIQLPRFSDVSWSRMTNEKSDGNIESQQNHSLVNNDYSTFPALSQPHSDINQMSGGQLHYTQGGQPEGQSCFAQDTNFPSSHVDLQPDMLSLHPATQHQQCYEQQPDQCSQHYQEPYVQQYLPQEGELTQFSQLPNQEQEVQAYEQPSYLPEEEMHLAHAQHQNVNYTPSPTHEHAEIHQGMFTENPPVQQSQHMHMSSQAQNQQQMIEIPQNYHQSVPPHQSPKSPDQHQLKQQHGNSAILAQPLDQVKTSVAGSQNKTSQRVSEKVTRAITAYLTNRNSALSKRTIAEVPLVVRHKLLATMLSEGVTIASDERQNKSENLPEMQYQQGISNTDNTTGNQQFVQTPIYNNERDVHAIASTPSQNEEYSYAGLIASTNNILYDNPNQDTMQNPTEPSQQALQNDAISNHTMPRTDAKYSVHPNTSVNRSLSEPAHHQVSSVDVPRNRILSHPNASTIDSHLLNEMMLSDLPTPNMSLPKLTSSVNQIDPMNHWSNSNPDQHSNSPNTNYMSLQGIGQQNSMSPLSNMHQMDVRTDVQNNSYNYGMITQNSQELSAGNRGIGIKRKKGQLFGPAFIKNKAVVIVQKADDLFFMTHGTMNILAPKRLRTCEQLGCYAIRHTPQKTRGRPPKNGAVSVRKGSYKKGKYPCPICGKNYAWKNYLRIHIAKHDRGLPAKGDATVTFQ